MKALTKIGSLLSSLQGNKILEKITKRKDQGFYKNETEFRQVLDKNLLDISSLIDRPLYVPYRITSGIAYSEVFNANVEDILMDLEVLFEEIDYLFSKIKSHEVFFDRYISETEILLKKLEQTVESAKIEVSGDIFFNKVFHNSFVDASNKTDFLSLEAGGFYYDLSLGRKFSLQNLCPVDPTQGKISLPKSSAERVSISNAKILLEQTTVSEHRASSATENDILNIITENPMSSWSYPVLTKKRLEESARLVIQLDFEDLKEFNSITISPNTEKPIYLNSIYVIDQIKERHLVDIEKGIFAETKTFFFNKILGKSIQIVFEQDVSDMITYGPGVSLGDLQRNPSLPYSADLISTQTDKAIKDSGIKKILGLNKWSLKELPVYYYYNFSIQSISVSNNEFRNTGVYVSKFEKFKNLRNLGLYVKETIPKTRNWETKEEMLAGSIEYTLFKKDYNSAKKVIKTSAISVLPIGTTEIANERLFFGKSNTVSLRFLGHKISGDGREVKIYRNGEPLIRGVDWYFNKRQSEDLSDYLVDSNETSTMITITHVSDQISNGVYSARYIPRFILEPDQPTIDNGIRFLDNCSVVTPSIIHGQEVLDSDIYVQIIIRNHTSRGELSPYVDYYRIAGKEE